MEQDEKRGGRATPNHGLNVAAALEDSVIITGDGNIEVGKSGTIAGRDIAIKSLTNRRVLSEGQAFERIGAAVRLNLEQFQENIAQARKESSQFFRLTVVFAGVGFAVVVAGVALLLAGQVTAGVASSIASTIPEVTAALFLRKDKELRNTIERYHEYILDSQRLLTMIDVAETVNDTEERDSLKRQIICSVLGIEKTARPGKANT